MTDAFDGPRPIPHRPYSRIRGKRERSVTEIIELKGIPALPWAAAKVTGEFAYDYPEKWKDLPRDEAVEVLRKHHRGIWDSRAAIGTACHTVMEAWDAGETVDLYEIVCDLAAKEYTARTWQGIEDLIVERITPYVDGLERWWNDWEPHGGTTEECVRTPGIYIGQRDRWNVTMRGKKWGVDLKCTAQQDSEKGVYGDSWTLQLAAYRHAEECVEYDWDENGKIVEVGTYPNEPVDATAIIHLRGDQSYTLFEVPTDETAHQAFLTLAHFNTWLRQIPKPVALNPHEEAA